jgi:hypothetical protein
LRSAHGGAVRSGQSIAQRTNWNPEKRKTEKKKKGMQDSSREQSDTQGFLGKNTLFERSEERKIFSQKPEGLDLAVGAA